MAEAWLYDGESAVRQAVSLEPAEGGLVIVADGAAPFRPGDGFVHVESRSDVELYGRTDVPGWRLGVPKPLDPAIAALLPGRRVYGRWIDRIGLTRALLAGAVLSGLILLAGHNAPAWLAPLVPESLEQRFGDALVGDLGGQFCAGPGGQAALDKLAAKLSLKPRRLKVRVVDMPVVNAVALPGGNIVIFRELLAEADGPDEVAGVLGHEIAHIENRDTTQAMIRQYGFSLVITALGGTTGGNIDMLASAGYSRAAESKADEGAIAALRRANISPLPTAAFFKRLAAEEAALGRFGQGLSYMSSHPMSDERRRRFEASAERGHRHKPALTRDEWDALADICHNDPAREEA